MNDQTDLNGLRGEIDILDSEIVNLLRKRFSVLRKVSEYKEAHSLEIYDAEREKEVFSKIGSLAEEDRKEIAQVYRMILKAGKDIEKKQFTGYGLVGEKLSHSYSKIIHEQFGYQYKLFEIDREDFADFIRKGKYKGLNITTPYKEAVIPLLDDLTPDAERVGAVNTVIRMNNNKLIGYNTDVVGFAALVKRSGVDIRGKKCAVLGSGGASKAVQAVLRAFGAARVSVVSRQGYINYDNLERIVDTEILVNTTPVGMYPNETATIVDPEAFPCLKVVYDLIYNPSKTVLMLEAEKRGIDTYGGAYMLVVQAIKAAELFTGKHIDRLLTESIFEQICGIGEEHFDS